VELLAAEIMLADPGEVVPFIEQAASLRWLQSSWAGINALFDGTTKRDYACTRIGGVFGPLMAEYVLGYVLLIERRLVCSPRAARRAAASAGMGGQLRAWPQLLARELQHQASWDPEPFTQGARHTAWVSGLPVLTAWTPGTRPVTGLTMGLLGAGDIGSQVAVAAKALGMRTVALKRAESEATSVLGMDVLSTELPVPHVNEHRHAQHHDECMHAWHRCRAVPPLRRKRRPGVQAVLGAADFIVSSLPSTAATRGMLDNGELAACLAGRSASRGEGGLEAAVALNTGAAGPRAAHRRC
jgi:phosphoglycerate dehydrogenase-like enzyme